MFVKFLAQGDMMLFCHGLDADIIGSCLLPGLRGPDNGEAGKLPDLRNIRFKQLIVIDLNAFFLTVKFMESVFRREGRSNPRERPSVPVCNTDDFILIL